MDVPVYLWCPLLLPIPSLKHLHSKQKCLGGPQQQASPDSTSPSATEGTDSGSASLLHDPQELRTDQDLDDDLEEDHEEDHSRGQTPGSGHKKRKRRVLFKDVTSQEPCRWLGRDVDDRGCRAHRGLLITLRPRGGLSDRPSLFTDRLECEAMIGISLSVSYSKTCQRESDLQVTPMLHNHKSLRLQSELTLRSQNEKKELLN
ncbi:hypothetical protein J6590_000242 [Homalodisca vitripennis]|nr:hypothetical protein J6590_000242 [Homalodisca vitripennis]